MNKLDTLHAELFDDNDDDDDNENDNSTNSA
jgi:hypothetical protein